MKRRLAVACLLVLACASPLAAQESKGDRNESPTPKKAEVGLPEGKGAWAVRVLTSGGFAGHGRGDVTVYSDGRVTCTPPAEPCAERRPADALAPLSRLVAAARPLKWKVATAPGVCNDCYVMQLVVRRRESKGRAKTYTITWDESNTAGVTREALRIYEAAVALASAGK
ncbi:MAG TPA: hypothetical protein VF588_04235 [Pyrinomonadaceae bacterium]|jgi:hypothetical protein